MLNFFLTLYSGKLFMRLSEAITWLFCLCSSLHPWQLCSHTVRWGAVTVWPLLFDVYKQELWVQGHFPLLWPYTRGQAGSQASVELLKARGERGTVPPPCATSFSTAPSASTFPLLLPGLAAAPLCRCDSWNTAGNRAFSHFPSACGQWEQKSSSSLDTTVQENSILDIFLFVWVCSVLIHLPVWLLQVPDDNSKCCCSVWITSVALPSSWF